MVETKMPESSGETLPGDALVTVRGLAKTFSAGMAERLEILREADLELRPAETLAVVGASGIGKSTLLHILGTLDRPDSGTMLYQGRDVLRFNPVELARFRNAHIGFVFQFHHLLPEFSAIENAMMPLIIQGQSRRAARGAAAAILERVGLSHRLNHRVTDLSGGEQQRVALARALIRHPGLLLADEPTGNLDNRNSERVHELLMELNREFGMTLVVVTHNMALAALMTRRITIIDGRLIELA
jgi:lipoprotein-releasing system ATP-binding protein